MRLARQEVNQSAARRAYIRRYAELIEARRTAAKPDNVSDFEDVGAGRGNKGIAAEIAEETGLSQRTVRRALNPKPAPRELVEVVDPFDAITAQAR